MPDTVRLLGPEFVPLARDLLGQGICVRFRVDGGSMQPFLRPGDVLTVSPVSLQSLRAGDVVLYADARPRLVLHRLLARSGEGAEQAFGLRGDARGGALEWVHAHCVLGRAVSFQRGAVVRPLDRLTPRLIGLAWARGQPLSGLLSGRWGAVRRRLFPSRGGAEPARRAAADGGGRG